MVSFLGKTILWNWEPSDLFQFYYDTTPMKGSLDELLAVIDDSSVNRAIKIGACNIFHGCVHNMLYEKSEDILRELYKSASFMCRQLLLSRQETISDTKRNCFKLYLPMNG